MTTQEERDHLDQWQRAVAGESAARVLVVGEHGTGKTEALIARVAVLLQRGPSHAHITCLTTTDGNAGNLHARMAGLRWTRNLGQVAK